ncbi:RSB1 [Candida pseudojiufengensis]|uniref:RSB1 n=1 Tax=Candida pseudojiufengensis TaxID=497109 RepID=UPI002224986F|nr:RSB1 [Candida pseudojiufengensis]KAI5966391.1 RSB1 [Candida pseudojiufengensis]
MDISTTWTPSSYPSATTLSSIATTNAPKLIATVSSIMNKANTETDIYNLKNLQQIYRGAQASLTIISAEEILATATEATIQSSATQAIFDATLNLKALEWDQNIYGYYLNKPANIVFLSVFSILMLYFCLMIIRSRYWAFNVTFCCGYALQFIGFLGRVLSFSNYSSLPYFLMNNVCLTISSAFIMAGIYFIFGQMVIIHDRKFSILPPLFYSYFFITIDILSILIQATGGAVASMNANNHSNSKVGDNIMIGGIVCQIAAMTLFIIFWLEFINRLYFKKFNNEPSTITEKYSLRKRSISNFFKLLFNVKSVKTYKSVYLESLYNSKYATIRSHTLFPYMPLAMTVAVIVIYIRCVYRVVELIEGYGGYLMTHEIYLLILDATMIAIAGFIFFPFHPVWVFGKQNLVKLASIRKKLDKNEIETFDDTNIFNEDILDHEEKQRRRDLL